MALQHAKAAEIVDLSPKGASLKEARTSAIVKTDQFEAVRLIVSKGALLKQHQVPGSLTLHCLEGRVELGLDSTTIELGAHEWVYLEGGAPHSVRGLEDSSLLLTIILPRTMEKPANPLGARHT